MLEGVFGNLFQGPGILKVDDHMVFRTTWAGNHNTREEIVPMAKFQKAKEDCISKEGITATEEQAPVREFYY
jgi:hypothetical protein